MVGGWHCRGGDQGDDRLAGNEGDRCLNARGLMMIFGGMCFYCRRRVTPQSTLPHSAISPLDATVDHDIPKCRIGFTPVASNNMVLCCRECNSFKADMTGTEFITFRQSKKIPKSYIEYLESRLIKRLHLK
jgi:5-methylcytosine-specific restriction endonuclease McrA